MAIIDEGKSAADENIYKISEAPKPNPAPSSVEFAYFNKYAYAKMAKPKAIKEMIEKRICKIVNTFSLVVIVIIISPSSFII